MVEWRSAAEGAALRHWWSDGQRQIAFGRDRRAFIAINDDQSKTMNVSLYTGLPAGLYCDVTTGQLTHDRSACTGRSVTVSGDGRAQIYIEAASGSSAYDPLIAIHVGAVQGSRMNMTNVQSSTAAAITSGFHRTVVFVEYHSQYGQNLFLRGGISYERRPQCNADPSQCSIAIRDRVSTMPSTEHYAAHRAWSVNDTKLDWHGAESGQGVFNGRTAGGTPTVWTTNDQTNSAAYHALNRYGDHQWVFDVDMDCSDTESGWFELKAYVTKPNEGGGQSAVWERDVTQAWPCHGDVAGYRPYASANHVARCGYINTFVFEQAACSVHSF